MASTRVGTSRIALSPVGELLAHWRRERRMSQLVLSTEAGVTPRHVSFVESGRANPSRDMVLTLARALDVPLRERNQMLLAAGYAPLYRETGLDADSMSRVRGALDRMLAHHEPYPAVVMDRHWNVLRANDAAAAMFAWLLDGADPGEPPNVVRLMFTRLRPYVANWEHTGEALIQRVHREAVGGVPDAATARLLDEVLALPDIPDAWRRPDFVAVPLPLLPVEFEKGGLGLRYFSLVTTVGTPQDVTLQEIRVESFFPADESTEAHRWPVD
jgi:transcriptional regulator with XRE-family HTH domain